ncbi:hypothetical protein, partial [uncultured Clostridium sp.]|uniref:hypothetical protein n=1 Tax=uncultured Clostridium sp. TaxID=59620 RepID=UPI0025EFE13F
QKQYQVESNVKKALKSVIGRDFNESPPTIDIEPKIAPPFQKTVLFPLNYPISISCIFQQTDFSTNHF